MTASLRVIRDRLAALPHRDWTWRVDDPDSESGAEVVNGWNDGWHNPVASEIPFTNGEDPEDTTSVIAEFIAAAPETIAALLAVVDAVLALADEADATDEASLSRMFGGERFGGRVSVAAIRAAVAAHVDTEENR